MNSTLEKLKLDFKWALASRTPIILLTISFAVNGVGFPLLMYAIYQNYSIPGWSFKQILLLIGVYDVIVGISEFLFNGMRWEILEEIQNGRFDYDLVRPQIIFKFKSMSLFLPSINDVAIGIALIVVSGIPGNIINLMLLMATALIFLEGFNILIISIGLRYIEVEDVWYIGFYFGESASWPIKIYPRWYRVLLFVFPVILMGYAPASAYMSGNLNKFVVPIIISIGLFVFSLFYFKFSLRKYQSAGG